MSCVTQFNILGAMLVPHVQKVLKMPSEGQWPLFPSQAPTQLSPSLSVLSWDRKKRSRECWAWHAQYIWSEACRFLTFSFPSSTVSVEVGVPRLRSSVPSRTLHPFLFIRCPLHRQLPESENTLECHMIMAPKLLTF